MENSLQFSIRKESFLLYKTYFKINTKAHLSKSYPCLLPWSIPHYNLNIALWFLRESGKTLKKNRLGLMEKEMKKTSTCMTNPKQTNKNSKYLIHMHEKIQDDFWKAFRRKSKPREVVIE